MSHLVCPTCESPSISDARRVKGSVAICDSICANNHVWQSKWVLPLALVPDPT